MVDANADPGSADDAGARDRDDRQAVGDNPAPQQPSDAPPLAATRVLALIIIPFLVLASGILYLFPADTRRLFAWEIKPTMSAMMLGAAYAGGIWFFVRALAAGSWRQVQVGFPAVCTFASLLGLATILHWDRFIHDSLAFVAWAALYFTTPFIVLGAWLREQRARRDRPVSRLEPRLPPAVRGIFAATAILTLPVAVGLFLVPSQVADVWPWTLTPLTARVTSAMFALPGVVALGLAVDNRWRSAGPVLEAQILSVAMILVAAWRDQEDINFGSAAAWIVVLGLASLELAFGTLYVMRRQALEAAPSASAPATA